MSSNNGISAQMFQNVAEEKCKSTIFGRCPSILEDSPPLSLHGNTSNNIMLALSSAIKDFIQFFQITPSSRTFSRKTQQIDPAENLSEDNTVQKYQQKKAISYHFDTIFSSKSHLPYNGYIHYTMTGKENDPNVTLLEDSEKIGYVSKNLYVFSKIHDFLPFEEKMSENFDGELVIEVAPISKTFKKLYLCFPLKTKPTYSCKQNIIDIILQNEDTSNIEINLNSILPLHTNASYYETDENRVVLVHHCIDIQTPLTGFCQGNLPPLFEPPMQNSVWNIDVLHDQSSYEELDAGGKLTKNEPYVSKMDELELQYQELKEGFKEGIDVTPTQIMECDYVDAGYQNEIPTYRIAAGSDQINLKEQTLNWGVSILWLMLILLMVMFIGPLLFTTLATRSFVAGSNETQILSALNGTESFIFFLLLIPGVILTSIGANNSIKCPKNDDACTKAANDLILPGTILLGVLFFFIISNAFNKYSNPTFLGYKDADKTDPYYKYKPQDLSFTHLLNVGSAFSSILVIINSFVKS